MKFKFIGGNLCLDFINTVGDHLGERHSEYLKSYEDLLTWTVLAGIVNSEEQGKLLEIAGRNPAQANRILKKVIKLREILFEILVAIALKKEYSPDLLAQYNIYLSETLKPLRLAQTNSGFAWQWDKSENNPEQLIKIITWSAAALLTGEQLKLLKVCGDSTCGWLFLDTSKNKRRCWCDMKDCGNRNKFRRYYSKQKTEVSG